MFALQVSFNDGVSRPEILFVRRPLAVIGPGESAHVVLEDMAQLGMQIQISREIGRRFRLIPQPISANSKVPPFLEGVFEGSKTIDLGAISLQIIALDSDLLLKDGEPSDRGGIRAFRQASSQRSPRFPAIVMRGEPPVTFSFVPDVPVYIGRARSCAFRIDHPDVAAKHARIGFESGKFWVEDLGSTNGTFVSGQQISGRTTVNPGELISIGRNIVLVGVSSEDQLAAASGYAVEVSRQIQPETAKYPVLVSLSEVARPARIVLTPGSNITLGRDPGSDMWLGAPHVSRQHCTLSMSKAGSVTVTDSSTNGTAYNGGILRRGDTVDAQRKPLVLDFGGTITVALCFNEQEERHFIASGGVAQAFATKNVDNVDEPVQQVRRERKRTGTWFRGPLPFDVKEMQGKKDPISKIAGVYSVMTREGRLIMAIGLAGVVSLLVVVIALLLPVIR